MLDPSGTSLMDPSGNLIDAISSAPKLPLGFSRPRKALHRLKENRPARGRAGYRRSNKPCFKPARPHHPTGPAVVSVVVVVGRARLIPAIYEAPTARSNPPPWQPRRRNRGELERAWSGPARRAFR